MNIVKECFVELKNKKIESIFDKKIETILTCEEEQLRYALGSYNGIIIDKYSIQYEDGIGFRVRNLDENVVGRLFQCNRMEKALNDKYKSIVMNDNE